MAGATSRRSSTRWTARCRSTSRASTRSTLRCGAPTSPWRRPASGSAPSPASERALNDLLGRSIDDVGLSVRSVNSLKNSNIRTLADLVQYREEDLLKVKNVGEKALGEIAELLRREGLNLGMRLEEHEGTYRVLDYGTAPVAQPSEGED